MRVLVGPLQTLEFASRIIWQYALPRKVHPRDERLRSSVEREPLLDKRARSCIAVVSSLSCICASTIAIACGVTFDGLSLPGRLSRLPVCSTRLRNFSRPCLDASSPSRARASLATDLRRATAALSVLSSQNMASRVSRASAIGIY